MGPREKRKRFLCSAAFTNSSSLLSDKNQQDGGRLLVMSEDFRTERLIMQPRKKKKICI